MNRDNNDLKIFGVIANFVRELSPVFGKEQRSLTLYTHLIERTALINKKPIQKHISAFRNFCSQNQAAILEKNKKEVRGGKILYSAKVFIDMEQIFEICKDKHTENTIWEYLLTISALLDPSSKARQVLKDAKEKKGGKEAEFLGDIISKVESNVGSADSDNPMAAIGNMLQSGVFTDLISGMSNGLSDGSLDLSSLIGTVQSMVSGMNQESDGGDQNMDMLNNMMSTLTNISKDKIEEIE